MTTFNPLTPLEAALAEETIAYYISFVRSGDPNTFKLERSPQWAPYAEVDRARLLLQTNQENSTTESGSFAEVEAEWETNGCHANAAQAEAQQS